MFVFLLVIHMLPLSCVTMYYIDRVLLERLIVNRPHPWGLLITFIDLIKNPTYNFWKHEFVHCAPEIEKYASFLMHVAYLMCMCSCL